MAEPRATPSICAVVDPASRDVVRAVGEQTEKPGTLLHYGGGLGSTLRDALGTDADWIWIVDRYALPRPDALENLVGALNRIGPLPRPDLLTGIVRTPNGQVDEGRGVWYRRDDIDTATAAAARKLLLIRATGSPMLVHRDALAATPPRRRTQLSPAALLELSARILRKGTGYLVPESHGETLVSVRADGPAAAAQLVLGSAFVGLDRARVGYRLLERAGQRLTASEIEGPR